VQGDLLVCADGLSFWGGVDPDTGRIIDVHHPNCGESVAGRFLLMPSSRGSCSGSGVLLQLSLNGLAPAALVFHAQEEVLTLGALVSERIFERPLPVISLTPADYRRLALSHRAQLLGSRILLDEGEIQLASTRLGDIELSETDRALLDGARGPAARMAMEITCLMATVQGVDRLTDISRGHIDGCILAHEANLIFAEKLADLGAKVAVPTTINAISVDRENWRQSSVPEDFGSRASRLADAYVRIGARPTFTCAPYLLQDVPRLGERIGWSESNAVIFANTVLGARTPKHPDYFDLFIAMTGRAPESGVYTDEGRVAQRVLNVRLSATFDGRDELFWPLMGWIAGRYSPEQIPLIRGFEHLQPTRDDLKALCAAFGTTSGSPMLHIAGHTPEGNWPPAADAAQFSIDREQFIEAWQELNLGPFEIDLVAIGSPHASFDEVERIVALMAGRRCSDHTNMIVTVGRQVVPQLKQRGYCEVLANAGVQVIPDICWCSIIEPVFPPDARSIFTNSGKYAHYAHGLSGRHARIGSLEACIEAAVTGRAPEQLPDWLVDHTAPCGPD